MKAQELIDQRYQELAAQLKDKEIRIEILTSDAKKLKAEIDALNTALPLLQKLEQELSPKAATVVAS